jgi:hypothetical protein
MIVVQLIGGIGDQLFQYAAARNFSTIYNCDLLIDETWFVKNKKNKLEPSKIGLTSFNTNYRLAGSVIINNFLRNKQQYYLSRFPHTANYKVIVENKKEFTNELYTTNPPFYMSGEYKSEKYFEENIELIKEDLTINVSHLKKNDPIVSQILSKDSIAIYIPYQSVNKNHNIIKNSIDLTYYQRAINLMQESLVNPHFIFFTDVEESKIKDLNIDSAYQTIALYNNEYEWKNIYLMSKCKHFIADDSATSWWAAWLNFDNNRKVIIPQNFSFDKPEITHNKLGIQQNWMKI